MSEDKPREFWVWKDSELKQVIQWNPEETCIYVIEKSAIAKLQAENKRLSAMLEYERQREYPTESQKVLELAVENKRLRDALEKIVEFKTCEELYPGCEKYISYEAGWFGVANFAREALKDGEK